MSALERTMNVSRVHSTLASSKVGPRDAEDSRVASCIRRWSVRRPSDISDRVGIGSANRFGVDMDAVIRAMYVE